MRYATVAAAAATLLGSQAVAQSSNFPTIEIKGSKFFYSNNGTQFYIKGVAYQQDVGTNTTVSSNKDYTDPLADFASCSRDVPYLKRVNTNTIRVYALDPTQDHDKCMNLLMENDIYVIADLSAPVEGQSINRDDASWDDTLYKRYTSVIDVMQKYPNTLGFFAGNEVSNDLNNTFASAFVKAAVRDSKAYIKGQGYRKIPVGYATNDDAKIRENLADYFNCGSDKDNAIDFWGYNIYSWCGNSNYQDSGYADRTKEFENYSVPYFFAEYGCNQVQPRKFTEIDSIFGEDMSPTWSGAIMYMYFQEANNYGIVSIDGNKVQTLDDFTYYSRQMAKATPTGVNSKTYTPQATKPQSCPSVGETWGAVNINSRLPPVPNAKLCQCMVDSLSCVVSSKTPAKAYGDIFDYICAQDDGSACAGIQHNATTGKFGAYSMCDAEEKLSFVLDQYYSAQNKASYACNFKGQANTQSPKSSSDSCAALLKEAGTAGTGTVSSVPSGQASGSDTADISNDGSSSTRSDSAAASGMVPPFAWLGLQMGGLVTLFGAVGATMIFL